MAVTVKGFQGSVSDADMATQLPTVPGVVTSSADSAVSAVGGARQVSVAPGSPNAHFVKRISDAAETLTLAPPSSGGKWYVIAVNRQWSPTNTAVLEAVDVGIATDGTVPTAAPVPTGLPAGLRNNPGTAGSTSAFGHHQPLAWVHVRAADTTLTLFDLRHVASSSGVVAAASFAALVMGGLYRTPMPATMVPCLDGVTYRWSGTAWRAWASRWFDYATVYGGFNQGATGGGSARYRWENGLVHAIIRVTLGSSASFTGNVTVRLPFASSATNGLQPGTFTFKRGGTGQISSGVLFLTGAIDVLLLVWGTSSGFLIHQPLANNAPFPPDQGTEWVIDSTYESADSPIV